MPIVNKITPEAANARQKQPEYVVPPQPTGARPEPAQAPIFWVETMTLKPAPWNPDARTTRRAVADLIKRIEEEGFEPFRPILVSKDGYIGDGHRRWTAAQHLGLAKVPAIFTDKTVEDLWAGNKGARPVRANEWMAVHVLGGVTGLPKRTAEQVEHLLTILGEDGMRYLVERGQSPDIWRVVWQIGRYCSKTDQRFLRKTTYWLINHKMVFRTRKAMSPKIDNPIDPRMLVQAIENDLPLRQEWAV